MKFNQLIQTLTEAEPKDEAISRLQVQVQEFETKIHTRVSSLDLLNLLVDEHSRRTS